MNQEQVNTKGKRRGVIIGSSLAGLAVAAVAGFLLFSYTCPCERTPGGLLFGEPVNEPVADWSFANQVPLCQIQIRNILLPHSVNLNCMSTPEGELYLSCSNCDSKFWAGRALSAPAAKLRLNGSVYPVTLRRVMDEAEMDRAWLARAAKLQSLASGDNPAPRAGAPRADGWWTFNVESAI